MAVTPTQVTGRIAYWESLGLPKMRSTESKTYKETVEKIKWTIEGKNMFVGRKYSMIDFRLAVTRHSIQALDNNFWPPDKTKLKKLSLNLFLYNRFGDGAYKSAFLRCFNHEPKVSATTRYPGLLPVVIKSYQEKSNGGIVEETFLSAKDYSNLANVTNHLGSFYKKHEKPTVGGVYNSSKNLVIAFLTHAKDLTNDNPMKFDTHLLTLDWVWKKFPAYLLQKGYLAPKKQWNINDY